MTDLMEIVETRELPPKEAATVCRLLERVALPPAGSRNGAAVSLSPESRVVGVFDGDDTVALVVFTISADDSAVLTSIFFHPRARGDEAAALAAAAGKIEALGAQQLVSGAEPKSDLDRYLAAAGFEGSAMLLELSRKSRRPGASRRGEYRWEAYSTDKRELFASVFYRTLEGTQDVPDFPICHDAEKLMRSFEERGEFAREDFALLEAQGRKAGIVLASKARGRMEVLYFGVAPEMRGRGLGKALIEYALARGAVCGADELAAFVDIRNTSARRLYANLGFSEKRAVRACWRLAKKN